VKISVARTSSQDVPAALLNFKIDLGVISYVPQEPKLVAIPFFNDRLTLVVNPKHRLAKRHNVNISELSKELFIAHIVDSEHRWKVIQLCEKHHVALNRDVEMPTIESIKRFVEMGMGVAIVPEMCVRHEVAEGLLSELKIKQLNIPRRLYIVHRRNDPPSHAAEALLELIRGRQSKIVGKSGAEI
jgi:DNA-binding transcriptional LysR family regulator